MRKYSFVVLCLFFFVLQFFAVPQHALALDDTLVEDEADLSTDLLATDETEDPADSEILSIVSPTNAGILGKAVDLYTLPLTANDVTCLKSNGFWHLIQNTTAYVARDNLRIAAEGGMSVAAYVPIYWDYNVTQQVKDALATIRGIIKNDGKAVSVQRLWLDIEKDPGGRTPWELEALIQQALNAVGYFPTGIYTRQSWWYDYMGGSTAFRMWPLWYAHYDCQRNFNDWFNGYDFGGWPSDGWTTPVGKQIARDPPTNPPFNDCPICGGLEVDQDWIYKGNISGLPMPTGLNPPDGTYIPYDQEYVTLSCAGNGGAEKYRFQVQYYANGGWQPYKVYNRITNYKTFYFPYAGTQYRWRVQYWNHYGKSAWTPWSTIYYYW